MRLRFDLRGLALGLLAVALIAGGCGKSSTSPTDSLTQDYADDLALQTVAALELLGLDVQGAVSGVGTAPMMRPEARPGAALWDTTFTINGLTFEATRDFYDAQNDLLPQFGPDAVKLVWTSRIYGTMETPRDTATVGHSASLVLLGIQATTDTLVVNGAALDTLTNRFRSYDGSVTRYFYWNSAVSIQDVVMLKSAMQANGCPLSGTVTFVVQADRLRSNDRGDVEKHLTATVIVTFDGTCAPRIQVNNRYRYQWNMQYGTIERV